MEEIRGYVSHIIFRNASNGYTVFELQGEGEEDLTCVGTFQAGDEGEMLEVVGEYNKHAVHGSQLQVSSFRGSSPEDEAGM